MSEREPATRHLRPEELRAQLDLLSEERKTTLYRRRSPSEVAQSISGPSERTVTMFDRGIEALAGAPSLGEGTARDAAHGEPGAQAEKPRRRTTVSDTYRLPRLGKKAPLLGGLAMLLGLAMLAAAVAWNSSPRVSAERVPVPPPPVSVAVPSPPAQQLAPLATPTVPSAPAAAAEARQAGGAPRADARRAVEHLLAGRTRDALDAYRALVAEPGSGPELAVVIRLLEHELHRCSPNGESESCAR